MTNKEIQLLTLVNLISNDPDSIEQPLLSDEEQEAVYKRFKEFGNQEVTHKIKRKEEKKVEYLQPDWKFIFRPVKDENWQKKLVELFEALDE